MRDLIILGTGAHAAEMAELVERINRAEPTWHLPAPRVLAPTEGTTADGAWPRNRAAARQERWNLLGFIAADARTGRVGTEVNGYPVLGTREVLPSYPDAHFVPDNEYHDPVEIPPQRMVSMIDPSTFISRTARIGRGCVIYPNCYVGLNVTLGDRVFILSGCVVNHDASLEDGVVLCSNVGLAGSVHVEAGCYVGQAATVRQYLRLGRGSLIGMGAVVVKDVPANAVVVGNPARKLREREPR